MNDPPEWLITHVKASSIVSALALYMNMIDWIKANYAAVTHFGKDDKYEHWPLKMPEVLAVLYGLGGRKDVPLQDYRLVKSYDLYVSPEYYHLHLNGLPTASVYKRRREGFPR